MNPAKQNFTTPIQLRDTIYAFQSSRIVLTAYELDIFTHIEEEGSTSLAVAEALKTNPRATDRLMNALCAIGLLQKKETLFFTTTFSQYYLSKKSSGYMKGFMHTINMWDTWTSLTDVVKTGKSQQRKLRNERGEKWAESFIGAMHERASRQAGEIIDKIDLNDIHSMLDIGGGSGVYAMQFVKKNALNKATVFDLPEIIPITKKYIDNEGLSQQFDFIDGDYNKDDCGMGYDMTFLSAIVHINSFYENQKLVQKCYDSLNKNGLIVIQDHVMSEMRTEPFAGALFALNMLVGTENGDTYTESEIRGWLIHSGFSEIIRVETFNNAMMIGRKR